MSRYRYVIICLTLVSFLWAPLCLRAEETMSVQVKESEIRATPSFLGKIIAKVIYGELVTVSKENGLWKNVSIKGGTLQGWMHESALTSKRIVLKSGQTDVQTSTTQNELSLAGKGFDDQIEALFIEQNKNIDYTWINNMETIKVTPEEMNIFLATGEVVSSSEGGAQ
jgi:hypothetical protein